jgi:predicted site-specific integrase-resolvase
MPAESQNGSKDRRPWCSDIDFVEGVGGGLNLKRPKFAAIMDRIEVRQVSSHLVIAHKDRLARFGFPWFERFCAEHGTDFLGLNSEQLSPEQETVQDLLTIVHCFSARLYGLRNDRKKLKEVFYRQAPWMNREPKRCTHVRPFRKSVAQYDGNTPDLQRQWIA